MGLRSVTIIHHRLTAFGTLILLATFMAVSPASAVEPEYSFTLVEDNQPDLCGHMKIVFDQHFKHMWSDPELTKPFDAIFSANSDFAFSLLPSTPHDWRMTMAMRYSKVPLGPEFDAIQWHEGHAIFGGGPPDPSANGNAPLQPYLVAYVDIDNDGTIDTLVKIGFTRGYSWLFSRNEEAGTGEMVLTYRNTKIDEAAPTTISELMSGAGKYGTPSIINASLIRPFIYNGRTYFATYGQGFGAPKTKHSRDNLKRSVPPHEQMVVSSFAYMDKLDDLGRPKWTWDVLCTFDMDQAR
jgi:hypothetical protein